MTPTQLRIQATREIRSYLDFISSIYDNTLLCEAMKSFINRRKIIMKKKKEKVKVKKVMKEFKAGTLHSGSKKGPVVTNPIQAKAIAMSEQRKAAKGAK